MTDDQKYRRAEFEAKASENSGLWRKLAIDDSQYMTTKLAWTAWRAAINAMSKWQPIETAPRDRTPVLVKVKQLDNDRYRSISGRQFVSYYVNLTWEWALYPGFGCGDDILDGWMPLPAPPHESER